MSIQLNITHKQPIVSQPNKKETIVVYTLGKPIPMDELSIMTNRIKYAGEIYREKLIKMLDSCKCINVMINNCCHVCVRTENIEFSINRYCEYIIKKENLGWGNVDISYNMDTYNQQIDIDMKYVVGIPTKNTIDKAGELYQNCTKPNNIDSIETIMYLLKKTHEYMENYKNHVTGYAREYGNTYEPLNIFDVSFSI